MVWYEPWSDNPADGGVWAWRLVGLASGWAVNEAEAEAALAEARTSWAV
jgi:hypothetical protein